MGLLKEENVKKYFSDGENAVYCMLGMGGYVGHRFRQWYETAAEVWRLMFFDEKTEDNQTRHIESLIDDRGNYIRLLIDVDNTRRAIQIHNGLVFNDSIITSISEDSVIGDSFTALDGDIYFGQKVPLSEYLSMQQVFSLNGVQYTGQATNNNLIINFLAKNEELIGLIEHENHKRRS